MATPTVTLAAGVIAAGPAVAFVSANTRARSQTGYLGLQTDVVQFGGPMATGAWAVAATRVKVNSVPVVLQSSTGTAAGPGAPFSSPMSVAIGDARVMGT